jgi:hypothetical protein
MEGKGYPVSWVVPRVSMEYKMFLTEIGEMKIRPIENGYIVVRKGKEYCAADHRQLEKMVGDLLLEAVS